MKVTISESLRHLPTFKVGDLIPSQKDLKTLSATNYTKLKKSILEKGFCFPIFIWQHEGKNYIIDGHQRQVVFVTEGWQETFLPCVLIDAKDIYDAKEKLLICTSQYGTITFDGLKDFVDGMNWDWVEGFINFDALPVLDLSELKDVDNYELKEPEYQKEKKEKSTTICKCPNCGHEFEP